MTEDTSSLVAPAEAAGWRSGHFRLLQAATFLSAYDRFGIAPMLLAIAATFHVALSKAVAVASLYYLLYGLSQPVWGIASDWFGRVRVMRFSMMGATIAGLLSAAAPTLTVAIVMRALTGGLFAAVIPASLVYIGDAVPIENRHTVLTRLLSATSVGTACGYVLGGAGASYASWRLVFATTALAAGSVGMLLGRLPESAQATRAAAPVANLVRVLRNPAGVAVLLVAMAEGGIILGLLTFLAPYLESQGASAAVAGLVVGVYGFAVLAWAVGVRRIAPRLSPAGLICSGGLLLALGYGCVALGGGPLGTAAAALLLAGGWTFIHPTIQTWAIEVLPAMRAATISLFAASLYVGGALAANSAGGFVGSHGYRELFVIAAALAVPFGLGGALARWRFGPSPVRLSQAD